MIKKTLIVCSTLAVSVLSSGCINQPPPPKVQIIENNITKEVLIPYNDNIKKAVAILIKKVELLESGKNCNVNLSSSSSKKMSSLRSEELQALKKQINNYELVIDKLKRNDEKIIKNIIDIGDDVNKLSHSSDSASSLSSQSSNNEQTDYDSIIKEFAEQGTLK